MTSWRDIHWQKIRKGTITFENGGSETVLLSSAIRSPLLLFQSLLFCTRMRRCCFPNRLRKELFAFFISIIHDTDATIGIFSCMKHKGKIESLFGTEASGYASSPPIPPYPIAKAEVGRKETPHEEKKRIDWFLFCFSWKKKREKKQERYLGCFRRKNEFNGIIITLLLVLKDRLLKMNSFEYPVTHIIWSGRTERVITSVLPSSRRQEFQEKCDRRTILTNTSFYNPDWVHGKLSTNSIGIGTVVTSVFCGIVKIVWNRSSVTIYSTPCSSWNVRKKGLMSTVISTGRVLDIDLFLLSFRVPSDVWQANENGTGANTIEGFSTESKFHPQCQHWVFLGYYLAKLWFWAQQQQWWQRYRNKETIAETMKKIFQRRRKMRHKKRKKRHKGKIEVSEKKSHSTPLCFRNSFYKEWKKQEKCREDILEMYFLCGRGVKYISSIIITYF